MKFNNFKSQAEANKAIINKKVKIKGNTAGHNIPIGEIVTLYSISNCTTANPTFACHSSVGARTVYMTDFVIGEQSIEELEKDILSINQEIKDLKTEKELIESKIQFMKDNKLDTYDEDTFKAYHILSLLEKDGLDKIGKAKLISELIKK